MSLAAFCGGRDVYTVPRSCGYSTFCAVCDVGQRKRNSMSIIKNKNQVRASRLEDLQTRSFQLCPVSRQDLFSMGTEQSKPTNALTIVLKNVTQIEDIAETDWGYLEVVGTCLLQTETAGLQGEKVCEPGHGSRKMPRSDRLDFYAVSKQSDDWMELWRA